MTAIDTQGDAQLRGTLTLADIDAALDELRDIPRPDRIAGLSGMDRARALGLAWPGPPRNAEAVDEAPPPSLCGRCGAYWHCEHVAPEATHEERPALANAGPGFKWEPEPWGTVPAAVPDASWLHTPIFDASKLPPTIAGLRVADDVADTYRYAEGRRLEIGWGHVASGDAEHEQLGHIMDALITAVKCLGPAGRAQFNPSVAVPLPNMRVLRNACRAVGEPWAEQCLDIAIEGRLWERTI